MGRPLDAARRQRKGANTMRAKTIQNHNPICAVCRGKLHETTITHEEQRGAGLYLFQNVPAKVCEACGEVWIDEEVLQQIDRLIKEGVPIRRVETPVYDFSRALPTA